MIIEIISDYSCPFCYLAEKRYIDVLKSLNANIQIKHTSYQLDEFAPKTTRENVYSIFAKKYGVSEEVAKDQMIPLKKIAHDEGLEFNFDKIQSTHTLLAHQFAKAFEEKYKDSSIHLKCYQAYFEYGYNLSDQDDLFKIAQFYQISKDDFEQLMANTSASIACLEDLKNNRLRQIQGIPQLYLKGQRVFKGLVDKEVFKEKITQLYLKSMELK